MDFRVKVTLRGILRRVVTSGVAKFDSNEALLGCSYAKCREYISDQFMPGMTWENHGEHWEIHHVLPMHTFDLTDEVQQRACCNYNNLTPLWIEEHIAAHKDDGQ